MKVLEVRNVNDAYAKVINEALVALSDKWVNVDSRVGRVLRYTSPVITIYKRPNERVLFNYTRDANPFFHLMESLWILDGRNDVRFISYFNKNISKYSDNEKTFHGAYGYRLRMPIDQMKMAITHLKENPNSRRCVLSMWDPIKDLDHSGKDVPCNTHIYLKINSSKLYMTVCCRSNDVIWGCYGANAVHFSILQEYIASHLNLEVGSYTHFSNDFHIYEDNPAWKKHKELGVIKASTYYDERPRHIIPLMFSPDRFEWELGEFFGPGWHMFNYGEPFFEYVAKPMRQAWHEYKRGGEYFEVMKYIDRIRSDDWHHVCALWMKRRYNR